MLTPHAFKDKPIDTKQPKLSRKGQIILAVVLIAGFVSLRLVNNQSHQGKLDELTDSRATVGSSAGVKAEDIIGSWSLQKTISLDGFDDVLVSGNVEFKPKAMLQGYVNARVIRTKSYALNYEDIKGSFTGRWSETDVRSEDEFWVQIRKVDTELVSITGSGMPSDDLVPITKKELKSIFQRAVVDKRIRVVKTKNGSVTLQGEGGVSSYLPVSEK